jgi:hypothetical protein
VKNRRKKEHCKLEIRELSEEQILVGIWITTTKAIGNWKIFKEVDKAMESFLERLDLAEKARKTEIRGDRNFPTAL